jgi:hypothetical protein
LEIWEKGVRVVMNKLLINVFLFAFVVMSSQIFALSFEFENSLDYDYSSKKYYDSNVRKTKSIISESTMVLDDRLMFILGSYNEHKTLYGFLGGFEIYHDENFCQIMSFYSGFGLVNKSMPGTLKIWMSSSLNESYIFENKEVTIGGGSEISLNNLLFLRTEKTSLSDKNKRDNNIDRNLIDLLLGWKSVLPVFIRLHTDEKYNSTKRNNSLIKYDRNFRFCHFQYSDNYFDFSLGYDWLRFKLCETNLISDTLDEKIYMGVGSTFTIKNIFNYIQVYGEAHILKGTKGTSDNLFMGKLGTKVSF